jgi:hypothetical protein
MLENNLVNSLNGFIQELCPTARPLRRKSEKITKGKKTKKVIFFTSFKKENNI